MNRIKELIQRKTTWIGIAGIGYGIYLIVVEGNQDLGIASILAGIGAITGRDAILKIESKP